jgi:hypothetical protein
MVIEVLNFLGVPNRDSFFEKNLDASQILTEAGSSALLDHFAKYAEPLSLHLNHLAMKSPERRSSVPRAD